MVNSIAFLTASLATLGSASSVFLVTHQTSNETSGALVIQDQTLVFSTKQPITELCKPKQLPTPNMSCTVAGTQDGSACQGVYRGPNKNWDQRLIDGLFDKHKGNFVAGGRVVFPDHTYSIVQTDKRCAPYSCTSSNKGEQTVYKGFSCQI